MIHASLVEVGAIKVEFRNVGPTEAFDEVFFNAPCSGDDGRDMVIALWGIIFQCLHRHMQQR